MIPREEVLFTPAMAEQGHRAECPPEVMAELCRVYLAWCEAPEVEVGSYEDTYVTWLDGEHREVTHVYADDIETPDELAGKRVRLVEVRDE